MDGNKMIGVPEYAKKHGVEDETVRKWCRSGKLIGAEQDGKWKPWRIPIDAVPPSKKRNKPSLFIE